MQPVSNLYNSIIAGEHWNETKLIVDGVEYDESKIFSLRTSIALMENGPTIGKAISAECDAEILLPEEKPSRMAEIRPYVRVCNNTQQSEWIPQGIYYIDTREESHNGVGFESLKIHGYDAMMRAGQDYADTSLTFPATDYDVVVEIANKIGVQPDPTLIADIAEFYQIPLPTGYTMREVLGYIGAMYAGNFIITDQGKLRFIGLADLPPDSRYLTDEGGNTILFGGDRIVL